MMKLLRFALFVPLVGLLPACVSTVDLSGTRLSAIPQNCDETQAAATAASRRDAEAIAKRALAAQIVDLRGDLVASGLRRVRVADRTMRCRPYSLTGSLVQCRATARVCGR